MIKVVRRKIEPDGRMSPWSDQECTDMSPVGQMFMLKDLEQVEFTRTDGSRFQFRREES